MGAISQITDSVSAALGTNGSNSGLLPGVSNALGTDGSKNGLLNDPISMAAVAAGAAIATGGFPYFGTVTPTLATEAAAAATTSAATEAALVPLATIAPLGSSAVASVTAGTAATTAAAGLTGVSWLDNLLTPTNALAAAKIAAPVIVSNATNAANLSAAKDILAIQSANAQKANTALTTQLGTNLGTNLAGSVGTQASSTSGNLLPAVLIVGAAIVATKLLKHH